MDDPMAGRKIILKLILEKCEGVDRIELTQDKVQCQAFVKLVLNLLVHVFLLLMVEHRVSSNNGI
jgi:hypothetical protein